MLILRAKLVKKHPKYGISFVNDPEEIKELIEENPGEYFEFIISENDKTRRVNSLELKGKKLTLPLETKNIDIIFDENGYATFKNNESYLTSFSNFINESKNIKETVLFGQDVKVYCLGKDIKIHCKSRSDAEELTRIFLSKNYSVYLAEDEENMIVEITLLPSDILDLFVSKYPST